MQQIEQEVRQFIVDNFVFGGANGHFSDDDSLLEKGWVDSMGILSLVSFVEEKYSIPVETEELVPDNWDSVQRIARFVEAKLAPSNCQQAVG